MKIEWVSANGYRERTQGTNVSVPYLKKILPLKNSAPYFEPVKNAPSPLTTAKNSDTPATNR